jgi:hypothetical protein
VERGEEETKTTTTTTTELFAATAKEKKKHISEPNFKTKQRNGGNKTKQKQSTRRSALTALVGSENGVFWYFGHTTRVVCLPAFVGFRLKF